MMASLPFFLSVRVMSLPMFPEITVEEQQQVVDTVVKCLNMTKQAV